MGSPGAHFGSKLGSTKGLMGSPGPFIIDILIETTPLFFLYSENQLGRCT